MSRKQEIEARLAKLNEIEMPTVAKFCIGSDLAWLLGEVDRLTSVIKAIGCHARTGETDDILADSGVC